jgi:hypothetical protein
VLLLLWLRIVRWLLKEENRLLLCVCVKRFLAPLFGAKYENGFMVNRADTLELYSLTFYSKNKIIGRNLERTMIVAKDLSHIIQKTLINL